MPLYGLCSHPVVILFILYTMGKNEGMLLIFISLNIQYEQHLICATFSRADSAAFGAVHHVLVVNHQARPFLTNYCCKYFLYLFGTYCVNTV